MWDDIVFRCGFFELRLIRVLVVVDLVNGLRVEPGDSLTVLPEAVLHFSFAWVLVDAEAVLLSVVPPAFVLATVSPEIEAVTSFFILFVLALVGHPVSVDVNSHAVHVIIVPVAVILPAIFPFVLSYTVYPIVNPVSLID